MIRKKGVQFGNPETIRENHAIRTNLRIDSREVQAIFPEKTRFRENQTCTELRSTMSRHLLPIREIL